MKAERPDILPQETLVVDDPTELPEVLDMLVVGGGPAGTAAAFRARELGLSALVIDYDDLMKRIRDYAKDKLILPDFGGGDQMRFPVGEKLIAALHFPPIDKDEMCRRWKALYRRNGIPAIVGLELTGLETEGNGTWRATAWNHNTDSEQHLLTKTAVLAFGRGVPRRFDIPGNVEGIAFRFTDAGTYVGAPCCVIGGGNSAAEAVIAISNAKIEADDPAPVWWSYRGDKMPKVSKALAEVFFDAYVGNGNVRSLPNSEPVAVITAEDNQEYLCIRTDRKVLEDRPRESTQLEFAKSHCLACIGEDIPEALLNSIGIQMVKGGAANKKRMVVTPLLETVQPNLYLAGDILSPIYLETADFSADPIGFLEIKRRGNVKAALRDGVFVAEVIKQKLAGKNDIRVVLEFAEPEPVLAETVSTDPSASAGLRDQSPTAEAQPRLVRLLQGDVEAEEFPLPQDGVTTIGRQNCDICFEEDTRLSDAHASISQEAGSFFLRDESSENGVFLRFGEKREVAIHSGAIVKVGTQWLVFGSERVPRTFIHYDPRGQEVASYELSEGTTVVGRRAPDITLETRDRSLSRRHLVISVKSGKPTIRDLKSVNGTYLKIDRPTKLKDGDEFGLGNQLLRFTIPGEAAETADVHFDISLIRRPAETPVRQDAEPARDFAAPAPEVDPATEAGPVVTFKNLGKSFPVTDGQTICEIAEEHGLKLNAECHSGICGSDPIRIVEGHENLNVMHDDEQGTLEDICGLESGEHRLACMARLTGPVVVEIIED